MPIHQDSQASQNERFRKMALQSLKERARSGGFSQRDILKARSEAAGKLKQGITISDKAAKLMAEAIKGMLNS